MFFFLNRFVKHLWIFSTTTFDVPQSNWSTQWRCSSYVSSQTWRVQEKSSSIKLILLQQLFFILTIIVFKGLCEKICDWGGVKRTGSPRGRSPVVGFGILHVRFQWGWSSGHGVMSLLVVFKWKLVVYFFLSLSLEWLVFFSFRHSS